MMQEQMREFRETMQSAASGSTRLKEELDAERRRSEAQAERLETEARDREDRFRRELGEAERMRGFREKEEARVKEEESGRRGRSLGLFDGVGSRGRDSGARERIFRAVSPPPKGVRETVGREGADPLKSYRVPADAQDEEVRRIGSEGSRAKSRLDAKVEEPEEAEAELNMEGKDPWERLATSFERGLTRALRKRGDDDEELLEGGEDAEGASYKGAKGLAAFNKARARWERKPGAALTEVDEAAKALLGVRRRGSYRMVDVIPKLPFSTYNTKKRAFEELLNHGTGNAHSLDLAKGLVAQALRWVAFSLYVSEEDVAWTLAIIPDPIGTPCCDIPKRPDLQNCHLQDVSQVTALAGLIKDKETLASLLIHRRLPLISRTLICSS